MVCHDMVANLIQSCHKSYCQVKRCVVGNAIVADGQIVVGKWPAIIQQALLERRYIDLIFDTLPKLLDREPPIHIDRDALVVALLRCHNDQLHDPTGEVVFSLLACQAVPTVLMASIQTTVGACMSEVGWNTLMMMLMMMMMLLLQEGSRLVKCGAAFTDCVYNNTANVLWCTEQSLYDWHCAALRSTISLACGEREAALQRCQLCLCRHVLRIYRNDVERVRFEQCCRSQCECASGRIERGNTRHNC
jgi:hypothetical protein